ncbi:MAG: hypothetical protein PHG00_15765 [Methylococcales bacterium]|nr:hypothetical protein [Methylococcales bacterium]
MQRVIRRLGFADTEQQIDEISEAMYTKARWSGDKGIFQYVCVGKKKSGELSNNYCNLMQLDWDDIGAFLWKRFADFREKLPGGHVHEQWPRFGRIYGDLFVQNGNSKNPEHSSKAVKLFLDTGECRRRT